MTKAAPSELQPPAASAGMAALPPIYPGLLATNVGPPAQSTIFLSPCALSVDRLLDRPSCCSVLGQPRFPFTWVPLIPSSFRVHNRCFFHSLAEPPPEPSEPRPGGACACRAGRDSSRGAPARLLLGSVAPPEQSRGGRPASTLVGGADPEGTFALDAATGRLYLARPLDFQGQVPACALPRWCAPRQAQDARLLRGCRARPGLAEATRRPSRDPLALALPEERAGRDLATARASDADGPGPNSVSSPAAPGAACVPPPGPAHPGRSQPRPEWGDHSHSAAAKVGSH